VEKSVGSKGDIGFVLQNRGLFNLLDNTTVITYIASFAKILPRTDGYWDMLCSIARSLIIVLRRLTLADWFHKVEPR
jgi:hypothetical protein